MQVDADEEDQEEHRQHPPELSAAPLGQTELSQELSTQVLHLLTALTLLMSLVTEGHSVNTIFIGRFIGMSRYSTLVLMYQNILVDFLIKKTYFSLLM